MTINQYFRIYYCKKILYLNILIFHEDTKGMFETYAVYIKI